HHDLPEESEEQDKPNGSHLRQDGQIVTVSGLCSRRWYANLFQCLSALLHRGCAVVQAHSEDWVLQIALECSLEHVETHQQGSRPRPKVNQQQRYADCDGHSQS